jgi:hypothetical protein
VFKHTRSDLAILATGMDRGAARDRVVHARRDTSMMSRLSFGNCGAKDIQSVNSSRCGARTSMNRARPATVRRKQ